MLRLAGELALSFLKAAIGVAAIIGSFWAVGLTEVWGTVGAGGMAIIVLGMLWAVFFDREVRTLGRAAAFVGTYVVTAELLYTLFERYRLVSPELRFVLEGVALAFASCLLFSSNGAEAEAAS